MVDMRYVVAPFAMQFAIAVGAAHAEEPDEHDHRAHEAHVHGTWELFAALDDAQLSVTLKGPLVDLVGFERPPETKEEHDAIQAMHDRLGVADAMLTLNKRAGCTLSEPVRINLPEGYSEDGDDDHDHDHEEDHKSDHHGHNEEAHHDHDANDDDHHDHEAHEHDEEEDHHAHTDDEDHHADHDIHDSDLEITYAFSCQSPDRLRAISMTGFETFPGIEQVDAVFLGDAQQTASRLGRNAQTLTISD